MRSAFTSATIASSAGVGSETMATSPSGRSPISPCAFALARSPCPNAATLIASIASAIENLVTNVMTFLLLVRGGVQVPLGQTEQLGIAADQRQQLLIDLEPLLLRDVDVDVEADRLVGRLELHCASRCERRGEHRGGRRAGRTICGHREFSSFSVSRCSKSRSSPAASVRSTALRTAPSSGPRKLNESSIGCPSRKSGFAPRAFNVSVCSPPSPDSPETASDSSS